MGILDGIVEWIAEQVMYGLDLINTSVLGALGCNMSTFLRYFPAAETMYHIFVALAIGMILLNLIWQLFKNYGLVAGVEAEDPVKLTIRSVLFILLAYFADEIVELILKIGGTPYAWIMSSELPALNFTDFNSVILTIIGVCANGAVALIALILVLILAWNYITVLHSVLDRIQNGVESGFTVFLGKTAGFSYGIDQFGFVHDNSPRLFFRAAFAAPIPDNRMTIRLPTISIHAFCRNVQQKRTERHIIQHPLLAQASQQLLHRYTPVGISSLRKPLRTQAAGLLHHRQTRPPPPRQPSGTPDTYRGSRNDPSCTPVHS